MLEVVCFFVNAFSAERGSAMFPKVALIGVRFKMFTNSDIIVVVALLYLSCKLAT
jgi:hypothetical protein